MKPQVRRTLARKPKEPPARTFAVGDIHGHRDKLDDLLPKLFERAKPGDSLVFVGDYIDRGPDSRGVVERVIELQEGEWPGPVVTLKGNHEWMFLDYVSEERRFEPQVWARNGGIQTIQSYADGELPPDWYDRVPERHRQFYASLRLWHRDPRGIYIHAGLRPGQRPEDADEDEGELEGGCLWIREPFIHSSYAWKRVVVFGHTPQRVRVRGVKEPVWQPLNRPEKIGIDTGCAFGGPLTAVVLPQRGFLSSDD